MKKEQKQDISFQLGKTFCKFINKYCAGMHYSDLTRMFLLNTYSLIDNFVRNGIEGCKKNRNKRHKKTMEIFHSFSELTWDELRQEDNFTDDEEGE